MKIDLNCDMGESFGIYKLGEDEAAMPLVTSINVACGFHASDPTNIWKTIKLAKKYGVAVGAHPAFPDLVGFGRRAIVSSLEEIKADVIYQIGAVKAFCDVENVPMQHVKVHGALYNLAEKDEKIAQAIGEAIKVVDENLIMLCMANSKMVEGAKNAGVRYVEEVFADRAYTNEGNLVARSMAGAVIHDPAEIAERVLGMVKEQKVKSIDGKDVPLNAQTICVHGDTMGAVDIIKSIKDRLVKEGLDLEAFGKWL